MKYVTPPVAVKVAVERKPEKVQVASSLPVTQVKLPQVPLNTPNLVSKPVALQVDTVTTCEVADVNVCHLPGAVLKSVTQLPSAVVVPPTVVPDTVPPQAIGVAAKHAAPPLGPPQEEH